MDGRNVYKVAESITKDEILQVCNYGPISEYGDIFDYNKFVSCVECYGITDYDGYGELVLYDKEVKNSSILCDCKTVYFCNNYFVPFDVLYSIFGDDMKFIWFNN